MAVNGILLDTSFAVTRLSPFYRWDGDKLNVYASKVAEIVRASVGGHEIDGPLRAGGSGADLGILESCTFSVVSEAVVLSPASSLHAIVLSFKFEMRDQAFIAVLLPQLDSLIDDEKRTQLKAMTIDGNGRRETKQRQKRTDKRRKLIEDQNHDDNDTPPIYYPYLLSRLPHSILSILLDYLSTRFDCHTSPLKLSSLQLGSRFLQQYMDYLRTQHAQEGGHESTWTSVKVLELVYHTDKTNELKRIVVSIPRNDIRLLAETYECI